MVQHGVIVRAVPDGPARQAVGLDPHPVGVAFPIGHFVGKQQGRCSRPAAVGRRPYAASEFQLQPRRPRHLHRLAEGHRHPDVIARRVGPVRPRVRADPDSAHRRSGIIHILQPDRELNLHRIEPVAHLHRDLVIPIPIIVVRFLVVLRRREGQPAASRQPEVAPVRTSRDLPLQVLGAVILVGRLQRRHHCLVLRHGNQGGRRYHRRRVVVDDRQCHVRWPRHPRAVAGRPHHHHRLVGSVHTIVVGGDRHGSRAGGLTGRDRQRRVRAQPEVPRHGRRDGRGGHGHRRRLSRCKAQPRRHGGGPSVLADGGRHQLERHRG